MWWGKKPNKLDVIRTAAAAIARELDSLGYHNEFLPPVRLHDCVYMMTKRGDVYRLTQGAADGMEVVCKIRSA